MANKGKSKHQKTKEHKAKTGSAIKSENVGAGLLYQNE